MLAKLEKNRKRSRDKPQEIIEISRSLLSNWPDSALRIPNFALRSALFAAVGKGHRPHFERANINALGGISIIYTGALLDQDDLEVWEALLHLTLIQGSECQISGYRLLKYLDKTDTGKNRATLEKQLSRMNATALQVRIGEHSYEGSLIHEIYRDHATRNYIIRLNPNLRVLFLADQFTDLDRTIRRNLRGKPLAQWLHGFYATHARPFDLKVETLHKLCGSRAICLADFKRSPINKVIIMTP
ncbi:plasmid replication initiator TrfA [Pseudomonas borbori]|uniref:TrfA protein n=1 Tax=Pseudomonas borbori TaxID=289003 RepID=A0A1I5RPA8_9PSED|nr:plasmid replication initiator TrfA [Pseudomonas borbori]SFP60240.1 TrfA protein [Pseudomonas borbori]